MPALHPLPFHQMLFPPQFSHHPSSRRKRITIDCQCSDHALDFVSLPTAGIQSIELLREEQEA